MNNLSKDIINRLIPDNLPSVDEIIAKYPKRNLKEGAMVTRIAPSPTWFVHIWGIFNAMLDERFAHESWGVFFMRLEDTDSKREIEWASKLLIDAFKKYDSMYDEWLDENFNDIWNYWPYQQSKRWDIYKVFIKDFLERWLAYPAFETQEELDEMRKTQEACKARPGYYWEWAKSRYLSEDEIRQKLDTNTPFVIRFRSPWNMFKKIKFQDLLKWDIEMSENDIDIVILKWDGLPTYHLAHIVDDHLMQTTHVIRWDEWLASTPLHIQLFETVGWNPPCYAHIAPIQKIDNWNKRKLSKRKDPEANMSYYEEEWYPKDSILEYLLNLANSDFEDWRKANINADLKEFKITFEKLKSHSGWALFDFVKLDSVSRDVISRYSPEKIYDEVLKWSEIYDKELFELLSENKDYSIKIFSIERIWDKVRKDIAKWSQIKDNFIYYFDDKFNLSFDDKLSILNISKDDVTNIINNYIETFDFNDDKDMWFAKVKWICNKVWFAENMKDYKNNPENYKWSLADVAGTLRVFITGKLQSPDLYSIIQVIWEESMKRRLNFN